MEEEFKIDLNWKQLKMSIAAIVLLFFFSIFGLMGLKLILAIYFFYFITFYFIVNKFDFTEGEKVIFSFFIGLGAFPATVFHLGTIFGIRNAIIISFVIFGAIALYMNKDRLMKK